jgi:hypothetical protein
VNDEGKITATMDDLIAAFTEWDRRYREQPEQFETLAEHLLNRTPETYGEAAATYFAHVLCAVQSDAAGGETDVG